MSRFDEWIASKPDLSKVRIIEDDDNERTLKVTLDDGSVLSFGAYENPFRRYKDGKKLERMAQDAYERSQTSGKL
jgi:hypothetical protein